MLDSTHKLIHNNRSEDMFDDGCYKPIHRNSCLLCCVWLLGFLRHLLLVLFLFSTLVLILFSYCGAYTCTHIHCL